MLSIATTALLVLALAPATNRSPRIFAFDPESSAQLWTAVEPRISHLALSVSNEVLSYHSTLDEVVTRDVDTGKVRWRRSGLSDANGPYLSDEVEAVFFGTVEGRLLAFSSVDGSDLWTTRSNAVVPESIAIGRRFAFGVNSEGAVVAFDGRSGEPKWSSELMIDPSTAQGAQAASAGVFVVDDTPFLVVGNNLVALDSETGKELWRTNARNVNAVDSLSESSILVTQIVDASEMRIRVISTVDGSEVWSSFSNSLTNVVLAQGTVVAFRDVGRDLGANKGRDSSILVGLDQASGEERWRSEMKVCCQLLSTGDQVGVFDPTSGRLFGINPSTGDTIWRRQVPRDSRGKLSESGAGARAIVVR